MKFLRRKFRWINSTKCAKNRKANNKPRKMGIAKSKSTIKWSVLLVSRFCCHLVLQQIIIACSDNRHYEEIKEIKSIKCTAEWSWPCMFSIFDASRVECFCKIYTKVNANGGIAKIKTDNWNNNNNKNSDAPIVARAFVATASDDMVEFTFVTIHDQPSDTWQAAGRECTYVCVVRTIDIDTDEF